MIPPKEEDRERLHGIMREAVAKLSEHFENVQLFCNGVEEGADNTVSFQHGAGNWHARLDHAREWVITHQEKNRAKARQEFDEDESGD